MDDLIVEARNEKYYEGLQSSFNLLQSKIAQNHLSYTALFRDEIKQILEDEIAFHQTLHRGRTEVSLERDMEIAYAKRILNDQGGYQELLKPR